SEWFLQGTEQPVFALEGVGKENGGAPRITAPANGTILALDPDIPPTRQRLRFETDAPSAGGLQWRIDGKTIARGASAQWLPWPGRHAVQLVDARGQVQDEIRLEVRGAGVRERGKAATR
ncbi:MAG: penicillin-binding protein 1C, partial [Comamonadaceae bacterium]